MGNKPIPNQFNIEGWNTLKKTPVLETLADPQTKQVVDKHMMVFQNAQQFQKVEAVLHQRRNKLQNVVQVLGFSKQNVQGLCSQHFKLGLFTQHLPFSLDQLTFNQKEGIEVLEGVLNGFYNIYHHFSNHFLAEYAFIGFNSQKQPRVWLSKNLTQSSPRSKIVSSQSDMVEFIFESVEKRLESAKYSKEFYEYLANNLTEPYKFQQSLLLIRKWNERSKLANTTFFKDQIRQIKSQSQDSRISFGAKPSIIVQQFGKQLWQKENRTINTRQPEPNPKPNKFQFVKEVQSNGKTKMLERYIVPEQFRQHFERYMKNKKN